MTLKGRPIIEGFKKRFPDSAKALDAWVRAIGNDFKHFVELKHTFGSADFRKPNVIFDVRGNKYRLVARVNYAAKVAEVVEVLTHEEYEEKYT